MPLRIELLWKAQWIEATRAKRASYKKSLWGCPWRLIGKGYKLSLRCSHWLRNLVKTAEEDYWTELVPVITLEGTAFLKHFWSKPERKESSKIECEQHSLKYGFLESMCYFPCPLGTWHQAWHKVRYFFKTQGKKCIPWANDVFSLFIAYHINNLLFIYSFQGCREWLIDLVY